MLKRQTIIALLVALPVVAGALGIADASLAHSSMNKIVGGCDACSNWHACNACMGKQECTDGGQYIACLQTGSDPSKGCATCIQNNKDCGRLYECSDDSCSQNCYYQGSCSGRSCDKVKEDGSDEPYRGGGPVKCVSRPIVKGLGGPSMCHENRDDAKA